MPLRFAQENLGHTSEAVARAYASDTEVEIPSIEYYENELAKADGQR